MGTAKTEWSIQEIARLAGTTSRTLRHYGDLGLLEPSRVGSNGYRYYDSDSLLRLQRILLLRELGLGLPVIAEVLDGEQDSGSALRTHLGFLERERERIGRQIESVRTTLRKKEGGEQLMASEALDGFDHTQYKDEVIEKWGREAYENSDRWWRSLSDRQQKAFHAEQREIAEAFAAAYQAGKPAGGDEAQAITQRHYDWVSTGSRAWQGEPPSAEYFACLGQMYVDDPRFTANYDQHGEGTAAFIRDAMKVYAERNLRG